MTKILLVEDDKSLREIYGVRLLAEGYEIISAGDGEEALAMAIKERPDLILSDVMMPKISGFDMLDILRSTTETRDIKVIMMTALSSEDQRQRGEQLGADRYLVKSQVGIEDVVRTVHDVLQDIPVAAPTPQQAFGTPAPSAVPRQPAPEAQPASGGQAPQPASLPQPIAPFSTPRPQGLGDRIINPLTPAEGATDMSQLMAQELNDADSATPPPPPPPPVPELETNPQDNSAPVDSPQEQTPPEHSTPETQPEPPLSTPADSAPAPEATPETEEQTPPAAPPVAEAPEATDQAQPQAENSPASPAPAPPLPPTMAPQPAVAPVPERQAVPVPPRNTDGAPVAAPQPAPTIPPQQQ